MKMKRLNFDFTSNIGRMMHLENETLFFFFFLVVRLTNKNHENQLIKLERIDGLGI